ncbi:MAG: sigma-70 family RNA polymerase sigma factor [Sneathiella sp.]|nr:sigma-70 family RNA polymerase sigma factor [Sneathiella sp.]
MLTNEKKNFDLARLEAALPTLRPELHRYCARMMGSVVDGEDILQETLLKASRSLTNGIVVKQPRAWLFRIAHNTALNYFRSTRKEMAMKNEISLETSSIDEFPRQSTVKDTLRPFLQLTPKQRSTVILRDVLGYSAAEVSVLTDSSVESVKSALHRGRNVLKEIDQDEAAQEVPLDEHQKELLSLYAKYFNDQDFDRLRDMLSEEVRLQLVSRVSLNGKEEVSSYFGNYQKAEDWIMTPGCVEGRPAILVFDRTDPSGPLSYFILVNWDAERVLTIQDFRYARYVLQDAQWERI